MKDLFFDLAAAPALALVLALTLACSGGGDGSIAVTGVTVSPDTLTLSAGGQGETLTATVAPAEATDKNVTWVSSSPATATVSATAGAVITVTPLSPGDTTITVTTRDGSKSATCAVKVVQGPVRVESVELPKDMSLIEGGTGTLDARVLPANAAERRVTWDSSAPGVAIVAPGAGLSATVTGVSVGTSTITVTTVDGGKTAHCEVTVTEAPDVRGMSSAAGDLHSLAVKTDGSLWAWGADEYGQLGIFGETNYQLVPAQMRGATDWSVLAAGLAHTAAIKRDGSLWTWGYNLGGQLGHGDTSNRWEPERLGAGNDWTYVAAGWHCTLAIKDDGSLWAWGDNVDGMLGLGDTATRLVPAMVGTDNDWATVSAGNFHTVALKTDGTIWAWGNNFVGQLGLGDSSDRWAPARVGAAEDRWAAVAAGAYHTLAIKADGSLWAWGQNYEGQLGLGDSGQGTYRYAPARVGQSTGWAAVSPGRYYTLALIKDSTLWAWGFNHYGQLGIDEYSSNKLVPTRVGQASDWAAVTAGNQHALAVKKNGELWAWGNNSWGEVGCGDILQKRAPVLVGTGFRAP